MNNRLYLADKDTLDIVKTNTDALVKELIPYRVESWKQVQKIVRSGQASKAFHLGDQFISYYGAKQIIWEVIGINVDTPADSNFTHSMTLQTRDTLFNLQFDAPEPSNPDSSRRQYGNNRYTHSAVRQWLNSDEPVFNWQSQHRYDAKPSDSLAIYNGGGFLYNLDPELVGVIGEVEKHVALNTVTDGGGQESFTDKVFLLSRYEVGLGIEGDTSGEFIYPFYNGVTNAGRIKQEHGTTTARTWWLRSPFVSNSSNVRSVLTGGSLDHVHADSTYGVSPACVII